MKALPWQELLPDTYQLYFFLQLTYPGNFVTIHSLAWPMKQPKGEDHKNVDNALPW